MEVRAKYLEPGFLNCLGRSAPCVATAKCFYLQLNMPRLEISGNEDFSFPFHLLAGSAKRV
jgi:hypothetical protein